MPTYEYGCKSCGFVTEIRHGMKEEPVVVCDQCESKQTERLISLTNLNTRTGISSAARKIIDRTKRQGEMSSDLRENLGVHDMAINSAQCKNYEHAYKEIKANSQSVKDTMKEKAKQNANESRARLVENHRNFQKIKDQRIKDMKERNAKTAYAKRAINPIKGPSPD